MLGPAVKINTLDTKVLARPVPPLFEILGTELLSDSHPGLPDHVPEEIQIRIHGSRKTIYQLDVLGVQIGKFAVLS